MISLRKFLLATNESSGEDLLRVIRLLLQGIALHAVEGNRQDYENFRADMQKLLSGIEETPLPSELLVATGSALKALEAYNQHTTRYVRMQGAELQNMIGMLTRTIAVLGTGSARSVTRLRDIEGKLEKASVIEDVRMVKLQMEQCLEEIREESQRQKTESTGTVESLKREIFDSRERIRTAAAVPSIDPVTGLATRVDAEAAFSEAARGPERAYILLLIVDRVALINSRFGYAVGDLVLKLYLEELRARFSAGDRMFRWSGPAFIVLLKRQDPIEKVRSELASTLPSRLERTVELSTRTVLLPISATWTAFPVALPLEDLIQHLDQFLSSQWQQKEE
jgi:GGDEF domain-containing protein